MDLLGYRNVDSASARLCQHTTSLDIVAWNAYKPAKRFHTAHVSARLTACLCVYP